MARAVGQAGRRRRRTEAEAAPPAGRQPKRIVLFSDGTGNSSAKLFKTNVWRLYEALDLGPPTPTRPFVQVAYYDNGVGTSQFRPLALLGGIFGFGLKRNILGIYRFLCRNYEPGDLIYAFGFSRGAFTIRLLTGLVAQQGVVDYRDERQLAYHARDAYRAFARTQWPNRLPAKLFARGLRTLRDGAIWLKRKVARETLYRDAVKHPTDIAFVGVWDTVAAYGGPSVEITRGIDDWIWSLTMPDYELSPKVLKARHALAIDDRRDAFQPLLWDEVREEDVIEEGREVIVGYDADNRPIRELRKAERGRLEQVWFAGMHADVGGGYPDETLSYVSLAWMMGEADLCLLPDHERRIVSMANAFGPIHNSRAGLASYYRYQPRKIEALLDWRCDPARPPRHRDRILRDPELRRDSYRDHGLLTEVKVHKSVVARIEKGTDGYAPFNLPSRFRIHPTEASEQPKEGAGPEPPPGPVEIRLATGALPEGAGPEPAEPCPGSSGDDMPLYERPGSVDDWARVWDLVWWRRVVYFLTAIASLALFALPWWGPEAERIMLCEDARCWGRSAFGLVDAFLPDFARFWTEAFSANFSWTLALLVAIGFFWIVGRWQETRIADRSRAILRGRYRATRRTWTRRLREWLGYQYAGFALKWYALPLLAAALVLAFLAVMLVSATGQTHVYLAEKGLLGVAPRCAQVAAGPTPAMAMDEVELDIAAMCSGAIAYVIENERYVLTLRVTENWRDGTRRGDPMSGYFIAPDGSAGPSIGEGHTREMPWYVGLFAPWRRVITADYLQPLIAIRPPDGDGDSTYIDLLTVRRDAAADGNPARRDVYRAEFTAARDGNLYLFVNDAVLPFDLAYFYRNNAGRVCISIAPAGIGHPETPTGAACGATAKEAPGGETPTR